MNKEKVEDFDEVIIKGEETYKTFSPIRCPYLESEVHFNAQGLEHLKFKRRGQARSLHDQHMRFKLLKLAPDVLKLSRTVQGIWETKHFERVRVHSRTDTILKPVIYYEFIAILNRIRIKVVVKQIDNGEKFFWSIIPFWGMNKETKKRKMHGGNPEED
ncbi:MAG: hypothetical protein AAB621_01480 [Patescibacteria group bacterium]